MERLGNDYFVYAIHNKEIKEDEHYLSFIPQDIVFRHGIPNEAIMGKFIDAPDLIDANHFQQNSIFVRFLHKVISSHARDCPSLIAEAKRQKEGSVVIVDGRSPNPSGTVPPEDIIGAASVEAGEVTGYLDNPNYRVWTTAGLLTLEPWLMSKLLDEGMKLTVKPR